jgi:hypothetical protein
MQAKQAVDVTREQIAQLVPKPNIETWILCLNGQAVDEDTDYKRRRDDWTELIHEAAETHLSGLTKKLNCRTDASTLCGAESAN